MASPKSRPRDGYPGRALGLILVIVVALVAIMFGTGNTKPRLGIDLAGGTSVTLQAYSKDPKAINSSNMATAVSILQQRVNGQGVSEATVQTQGSDTILVSVPKGPNSAKIAQQVGETAKLFFRPVVAAATSGVPASQLSPSPSASGSTGATSSPSPSVSAQASSKASAGASASASAKTQGDAVSQALTAGSTASASATASDSAKSSAAASPSAPAASASASAPANTTATAGLDGTVPAALTSSFDKLNCADPKQRAAAAAAVANAANTAQVVACDYKTQGGGLFGKYVLGPVAVSGTDLSGASANVSSQNGGWEVDLSFNSKATKQFADITKTLAAQPQGSAANRFAITLDGAVYSAPGTDEAITGGQASISGSFTASQAKDLANVLKYGALPLNFRQSDITTVSAQLGSSQLQAGLIAGGLGLLLVVLYSLIYYRGLALVSVLSLAVSAVLTWSIMSLLGATMGFALNLPAICGAIVAIGITADSFVVYFERIRDELREGSSLRPAVQRGWPRARRTILVSDFVSFLAAAVLYFFTVGKVQGFAFTLGLTTLLDVVVIFLFTKPLLTLLARRRFFSSGHPWSGVSPDRLGVRAPLRSSRPRSAATREA